ncbi:hypothetical protein OGAPHI_001699 [Ogataea philodendri]|uniref:Uncharacterized protein n=1 Tax=Ogataea philodendri TaxID=1378263 RepID=A0A9P8PAF1_9ASCO|nr:uncharacterized protein OGAPHI_001699 [Ogataea philodendri]KAH3667945.1 hypothetical protein OGAPHI_001699 [Ogataea philodendri]
MKDSPESPEAKIKFPKSGWWLNISCLSGESVHQHVLVFTKGLSLNSGMVSLKNSRIASADSVGIALTNKGMDSPSEFKLMYPGNSLQIFNSSFSSGSKKNPRSAFIITGNPLNFLASSVVTLICASVNPLACS